MQRAPLTTYLQLCTEYYDLDKKSNERDTLESIEFYLEYGYKAQGPILEPMCGTGRILIPLLQEGLAIEGFDASGYMLDAARQKYATLYPDGKAPIWQEFVQDFRSDRLYQLIFVPFGSWGLIINLEDSKKSIKNMYAHLAPGGKLLLEIETVASVPVCNSWNRELQTRENGTQLAINTFCTYDHKTQIFQAICRYESITDSHREEETEDFQMYLYRFDEMDRILGEAGFVDTKKYKNRAKDSADKNSPLLIYECSK